MNLPSNNPRAGVTLLESLMMLAVLALVMGLAASGFQARNRPDDPAGIRAKLAQVVLLARNDAMQHQRAIKTPLSQLNADLKRTPLHPCDAGAAELTAFPDGTILAPTLCTGAMRFNIDWLTGAVQRIADAP